MVDHELSDADLVLLSLTLSDNYGLLVDRYYQKLFRYVKRISGIENESCEDLLQEIFLKVYLNLREYDKSLPFSSWLYRIAYNVVISDYRKRKTRKDVSYLLIENDDLDRLVDEFDIQSSCDQAFLKKRLEGILKEIRLDYRDVLVLYFLEEKSYKEISDIMKKPIGTIATLLNRAKKEFKKTVEKNKNFPYVS